MDWPAGRRTTLFGALLALAAGVALAAGIWLARTTQPEVGAAAAQAAAETAGPGAADVAAAAATAALGAAPVDDDAPFVSSRYMQLSAQASEVLPSVFLTPDQAAELGLQIVPNGFDNLDPPSASSVFRFPLPGQTPVSIIVSEFYDGRFLVGRAQSYVRTGAEGKFGIVAWAFESEDGAQRGYRAFRDLAGRRPEATDFAPIAADYADDGLGIAELIWVRGRLLLRATYAVPDDDLAAARALRDRLARIVDDQSKVAAQPSAQVLAEQQAQLRPTEPGTLDARLRSLRVPDLELPGGFNTDARHMSGDEVFFDPTRGSGVDSSVNRALEAAGFLGGHEQAIRIVGQPRARFGLYTWAFPSESDAEQALEAFLANQPAARTSRSALFDNAWIVRGPNGDNFSEMLWVRGSLLLQVGLYSHQDVPQKPEVRDRLARLLDERAAAW